MPRVVLDPLLHLLQGTHAASLPSAIPGSRVHIGSHLDLPDPQMVSHSLRTMSVEYEQRGRIGLIRINRPEARNAVNADVPAGIESGVDTLEGDPETWVGVITGEGPVFSAGADLKAIAAGHGDSLSTRTGGFAGITRKVRSKPIVAAVDGDALAGGCEIALACDLIVA